ncbi:MULTISPECIES: SDR family NAD(P)-dependent oxidoreductase [unclassified Streptomyces]|uniref:SDR family NAD(P)-dependent oxidoreductase n=1 Tax=Streptomyces sp. NPDC055082 TaxID=3365718 RepID=UPI0037D030BB
MSSKTAVITGGAPGLGRVTARHLIKAGQSVVLVGRDATRTRAAADSRRGLAPEGSDATPPRTYTADLEQWSQVRALAAKLDADRHPVDVLINNAGAALPQYEQTPDGVERASRSITTPRSCSPAPSSPKEYSRPKRINMSSFVEKRGRLDATGPDVAGASWSKRFYNQINVYATSELVSLLAARELAHRLPDGMSIYNANPGMVKGTAMNSNAGGLMRLTAALFRPFAITPDEGVQTPVWLAGASPAPRPSGGFFSESQPDTPSAWP